MRLETGRNDRHRIAIDSNQFIWSIGAVRKSSKILFGLIGAGGFAREVLPNARRNIREEFPDSELVLVVDDNYEISAPTMNGHRVIRMNAFLSAKVSARFFNVVIADSRARETIVNGIPAELATPFQITAATHVLHDETKIGEGAVFSDFTIVESNVTIGKHFHCNMHSCVAHDCVIGDYVTFAPGVRCNGNVTIEDHAYVGSGAIIREGSKKPLVIGRGAVIGMGAVVTKSVQAGVTVVGNPARVLRAPKQ